VRSTLIVLALIPAALSAQTPRALEKSELIRLLTNPLFAQTEVADVVRRSCLGFRPTERDWADLRNAGAGGEVIASIAGCAARGNARSSGGSAAPAAAPVAPLTAVALASEVVATAGSPSNVRVFVHRAGAPQRRVAVTLVGTSSLGLQRDATAITDDSGRAVFPLPPVKQPGTYRFEIAGSGGTPLSGRPAVALMIRAGEPGRVRVAPDYIGSTERGATIVATVTDSLGNPVREEPVEVTSGFGAPLSGTTDSLGRASFAFTTGALPRGGALHVRVRALPAVDVPIADAAGLSGAATGFVSGGVRRGRVASALSEPIMFKARTVQGGAPVGRLVRFRSINARVTPDSAILDSTGAVALTVSLGTRSGEALVFATIDSVEKLVTLQVDPGPIETLVVEHNGQVVTGQDIVVRVAAPFVLRVTARDFYGNPTSIDALARMLKAGQAQLAARQRYLQLMSLEPGDAAVQVTLKAQRVGVLGFTVGSGITAGGRVEAVQR